MNEMGTKFAKRKKSVRIGAITLLLAVLLACVSVVSVFAAASTFVLDYPKDAVVNTTNHTVDWSQFFSTTDNVNLGGNGVFTLKDSGISGLKGLKIGITNVNTDVNVTVDKQAFRGLSSSTSGGSTYIYYNNRSGITASDVRNIFDAITISFKTSKSNGSTKVTVRGSSTNSMGAGSAVNGSRLGNIYTCEMHFYNFAQSTIDMDTLRIGYESESPDMSMVTPADKNMGKATFDVNISAGDVGLTSKLQQVQVGYAIKKATEAWNTTNETLQGAKTLEAVELTDPQTIEVTGFDANTDYDVKVVTITEGKTDSPKETASIRVRYDTPMVNTFNVGDTDAAHIGGNRMNIQATVAFNNTNYDNKTWIGQDDAEYTGAALKLEVFFTDNLQQEDGVDTSTWTPALSGEYSLSGERRSATLSDSYLLPEKDSPNCAYRLVATDLISGYKMYTYSKPFIVDSTTPTKPVVSAENLEGSLEDGTALVGGENANIELAIGDSVDAVSGVKEYAYSMYYVSSDDGDEFAMENDSSVTADNITSQKILQVLKAAPKKAGFSDSRVEITDWTTLAKEENANTTSLSLSKDGYYCVMARATDKVGKNSEEAVALFRVDLTAPNAPAVRMVTPKAGKSITVSGGALSNPNDTQAYDNRTYTDSEVWVFMRSVPLTGKHINTSMYQYSLDGGLTWKLVSAMSPNYVSVAGTLPSTYNSKYGTESFDYDVGFKLSSNEVSGYQSLIAKAVDTLGNASVPSEAAIMRTSDKINVEGSMSHEVIEVALALGNSTMKTATLTNELKNAVAKKINTKYYGSTTGKTGNEADWGTDKFSPVLYIGNHACDFNEDGSCKSGANCPYVKLANGFTKDGKTYEPYEIYTPQLVNVQGVTAANATDAEYTWVRYDHTQYSYRRTEDQTDNWKAMQAKNGTNLQEPWATVGYTGTYDGSNNDIKVLTAPKPTNLEANPKYIDEKTGLATATLDRVVALGQYTPATGKYSNGTLQMTFSDQSHGINYSSGPSETYTYSDTYARFYDYGASTQIWTTRWGLRGDYENTAGSGNHANLTYPNATYMWVGSSAFAGTQIRRIYHVMDVSYPEHSDATDSTGFTYGSGGHFEKWYDVSQELDSSQRLQSVANAGYYRGAYRDWLFLYNDQPTKKNIFFTVDDATLVAHANDGYGFFFNTTIRQSKAGVTHPQGKGNSDGSWRISGYMFMLGNPVTNRFSKNTEYDGDHPVGTAQGTTNTSAADSLYRYSQGLYISGGKYAFDMWRIPQSESEKADGYCWYIIKIDDVNLEHFADGTIRGSADQGTSGYGHADATAGEGRGLEETGGNGHGVNGGVTSKGDDLIKFLMYGGSRAEGVNGNYWISVPRTTLNATATYAEWKAHKDNPSVPYVNTLEKAKTAYNISVPGIDYGISQIAWTEPDVQSKEAAEDRYVRNFVISTEGDSTRIYCWNTGKCYSDPDKLVKNASAYKTVDQLKAQFAKDVTEDNPEGASSYNAGYKAIEWFEPTAALISLGTGNASSKVCSIKAENKLSYSNSLLLTERPTVDGVTIGMGNKRTDSTADADATYTKQNFHTDTNCYGFGPIYSVRSYSHACYADTRVVFSNMSMEMNKMRNLSEVVTKPQWGTGKTKYIISVADDSVEDFKDPLLVSNVQWRVQNDDTYFIGWGAESNRETTEDFIKRIDNKGLYVVNDVRVRQTPAVQTQRKAAQVDKVADYIANTYYEAFDLDGTGDITAQVNQMAARKGAVYTLDNVKKMSFTVQPESYNHTTANEDYPSGRWYIEHDTTGYTNAPIARSGNWSDALNLNITEPGRYSVYFAPDAQKLANHTLDPNDESCIFNFVVNQPAVPQFSGTIDDKEIITIKDTSYDPDTNRTYEEEKAFWNSAEGKALVAGSSVSQLTGITSTQWRWELMQKQGEGAEATSVMIARSTQTAGQWETDPSWVTKAKTTGISLQELTNGKLIDQSTGKFKAGSYSTIPSGAVLMLYERITDVSTIRRYENGKYIFKLPVTAQGAPDTNMAYYTSNSKQQNVTSGGEVTYEPNAGFSFKNNNPNMYDTAQGENTYLTVIRNSRQTQNRTYKPSWRVSLTGAEGTFLNLKDANGDQTLWQARVNAAGAVVDKDDPTGTRWITALTNSVAPKVDEEGNGTGEWLISRDFITAMVGGANKTGTQFSLGLDETARGYASTDDVANHVISDIIGPTARAVYYVKDETPPSAQTVDVYTNVKNSTGAWGADQDYDASTYLDVSQNDRRITVKARGSSDAQGAVAGYGYYFYDYAADGKTVAKIFTLNASGQLVEVTTGSTINDKIKNAIGWNASTQTGKSVLPASGGDIYITAAAMRKQPTDILNLAIFAFDNQKGITGTAANPNFTGANESTRTRLENIRLASFTPMPTEITAVNSLGEKIAYIDNVGGFKDASGNIPGDTAMEPIRANSSVTVSFTPRQGWFDVSNPQAPVYLPTYDGAADATHAKYYMDVSKEADLTNKAQIEYVIYKGELDVSGKNIVYKPLPDYQGAGGVEKPLTIEATKQVTVTDSGYYKVTARVKNGSNAYSAERTITFEIDKSAPVFTDTNVVLWEESTNTAYQENSWGRQVSITISGATDDNQATAYYVYSTDNGAHETIGEKGLKDVRLELNKSGEYILRVYAIDQAGNRSATVTKSIKIDRDGPVMHAPSLTAKSETTMMYSDYVISIVDALGGKVQAWNDGKADELNREISVKLNSSQQFLITPEDGYTVQSITCGGKNYSWNDLPDQGSGKLLTIENVASNAELNVVFAESGTISQSYMYNARMVSSNIMKARAAASNAAETSSVSRSAEIQADEATMYTVVNQTSVSNGTELLIADGNQDSSMIQVAAGGSVDVLITPKEGYTVESAVIRRIIGGTTQEEAAVLSAGDIAGTFKFTVSNIQSTVGIEVIYKEQYTHKLTIWASDHGTVTPKSGVLTSEGGYSFYQDGTVVLQMTAEEKYMLSAIRVNGVEMENVTGNEFTIPVEYTQDDVEVTVEFTADTANEENHYLVVKYNDNYGRVNPLGEVGETDDAGITSHKVMVANNDGWTFHVYPNPGYTAIVTKDYYSDRDGAVTGEAVELTKHADGGWVCSVDDITNNSNKLNINFVNTLWDVTYGTQSVKSNGEVSMEDGGTVTVSRSDGGSTNESPLRVPEGTNVTFQIEPKEGWRISSVKVNDIEMGTRKSYTLEKVAQAHDVQVTFEERAFTTAASSHSITALATLISDKEQSLHRTETYRFRLSDGVTEQWSDWQLSASYTFTNLQPNKKYRVTVQAQDISGNRSEPSAITAALSTTNDSSEIYTEANMPLAKSLSVADDENTVEKTVIMDVDNCGNPEDTEYKVYISKYRTMTSREEATLAGQNEDHWATLSPTGQLLVQKLNAGTHYYMQVIARNHKSDEEHPEVETTVNSKNIVDITLSPSSPPENTFFFEEQEKPGDPITLRWEKPEGEVQGYEIYRDGTLLERVNGETTTYVDDGIMGDTISQYSYAFVNSAGVGSRRTAVSEEYYLAAKGNANVKGAEEALIQPDPTKLAALDKLKTDLNADDVYNETMTYPLYPSSATRLSASPLYEDDEHSGRAEVLISGTMGSVARAQKYQVGLQAYTVQENEEGQKVYTPVNGWNWQDHMVWTKSADNRGAIATWENLDINLEYRVVVNEVRSTGPRKREGSIIVDGYAGSTAGIEGSYGKDCRVNAEGYYYTFTDDQAKAILNNSETVTPWAAGEADAYVQRGVGAGNTWGQPMGEFIQFNKSPHVALSDDPFDGNENAEFATVNGQKALVLHEGGNMKFTVKVKVWDVDGAYDQNSKYAITASMNGRSGLLTAAADKDGTAIDVKNILTVAQKEADSGIYTLTFDASQFSTTGIYGYTGTDARALSLSVSDGGSKATVTVDLPVIVNKSAPQIITENIKGVKSIENNRTYGTEAESVIRLTTAVENGSMDADTMRIIRLAVMSSQYDELFGVHTVDQIMEKLNNNDMKAVNSARKLLGNDTYSEYEKGGFNETETKTLVDKVTPSIVSYFEITEEQYNTHKETAPDKVMKDENGYYWAEKEYAFANGLCQFLERGADKRITVKVPEDKIGSVYSAMLTSTFGKNVTTLPISFRVVKAPSLTVRSDKKWVWVENVPKDEFKAYQSQNKTVGDVAEEFKDSYGTKPWEQEPDDPDFAEGTPAYKPADATGDEPEGTKYSVFRLKDSGVQIGTNWATLTLDIETGVYSKLNQVTAVLKTNTEPPTDAEVAAGVPCGELTKGIKGIKLSNLQPGTTYFVWFCYKVEDPDTGEVKDCRVDHYTAVTLINDYGAAYYSFNENTMDVREKDAPTNGDFQRLEFVISRNYSETGRNSYANLIPSEIKYYVADQDGYPLDQEGNQLPKNAPEDQMVELTGDKLEAAKNTLRLADNQEKFVFGANTDSQILRLWLYNTGEEQGHMLARVHLTIDPESQNGYNYIGDANGYMTVFVQDDESAVTVYIGELDREASSELNTFEYEYNPDDNTGLSKNCYEYSFQDLQNGYSSGEVGMLNLALKNTVGSSTLTGIEARIYKDNNGKPSTEPSTDFVITKAPNPNQLDPVVNEVTGTIRSRTAVSPSSSLEDGIYSAWLKLSWEGVERENVIWVRLHQVVGQSTLKGYIYLTSDKPAEASTAFIGRSNVTVTAIDNSFTRTVTTNEFGYYEMPNILNGKKYTIKVERPGFVTYNSTEFGSSGTWTLGSVSKEYELSFQLIGGDLDGNGSVRAEDYNLFSDYYSKTYDQTVETEENLELRKRDYNADGVVNALDRMVLWGNLNKSARNYRTDEGGSREYFMPKEIQP